MQTPLTFDIKRYAINDGPGIRIVVFLKGCNLRCVWCHNPESISGEPERMYAPAKCIWCRSCVVACPENAISLTLNGIITDPHLCKSCNCCAEACPTKAIELSGKAINQAELMEEIEKERTFFDQSGGGVTFSGGEPLLQNEFLIKLLRECGRRGFHRAVDTTGLTRTSILLEVAKHTDLFLYDLKMINSDKHLQWTGVPNEKILENLQVLAATGAKIIIRIPLIGGVNDDEKNITETAGFISELSGDKKEVNLLPYHNIAQTKYRKLGRFDEYRTMEKPTQEAMDKAISIFCQSGIKASIGG